MRNKSGLRSFGLRGTVSVLALTLVSTAVLGQGLEIETVTSTGSRAAVNNALELRRNATQAIDSIVAEDIGKLPDSTVVESLQHVTGVAIIRNNVEPSVVLIRGLPDIQTSLNGRAIFTSTGRSISLPDFPSELLARVDVHKASSATDIEGGIAGLIDIRLHRPFDFAGFRMVAGAQAVNTSLAGHIDPQASVLISDRWQTGIGEFGVLFDVAFKSIHNRQDQITMNQRSTIIGPVPGAGNLGGNVCAQNCPASSTRVVTNANPLGSGGLNIGFAAGVPLGSAAESANISFFQRQGTIERSSVNLSTQWRPFAGLDIFAEGFYSRLRQKAPAFVDVKIRSNCPDAANSTVFPGTNIVATGASGCYSLTSIQDRRNKEDTLQFATGADWLVTDDLTWTNELDVTTSKVLSTNYIPDTAYNYGPGQFTFNNNLDESGGAFINTVGNPQDNPSNLVLDQFFDQRTRSRGGDWQFKTDLEYRFDPTFPILKSIQVGARLGSRNARNSGPSNAALNCTQPRNATLAYDKYIGLTLASPACAAFLSQSSGGNGPVANFTTLRGVSIASLGAGAPKRTHGSFFGGRFGETGWVTFDPDWLVENVEKVRNQFGYSGPQDDVPSSTFVVNEFGQSGYMKVNFGFNMFGTVPVDGNVGVRIVNFDLTEQAFLTNQNAGQISFTPTTARKRSTDTLPSINLRFELDDGFYIRLSGSKTVTRPSFGQLNPAQSFSGAGQTLLGTSSSGNPNLKAVKSDNVDIDASWYWGNGNHFGVSLFHRDVSGYIQTAACTPATVPGCSSSGQIVVNTFTYNYSLPQNFQDAPIDGFEVGYSQFLDFLPGAWGGFGWDVNATYISGVFNNITKWHANAAGIYEYGPFSARVSYTWSSSYLQSPTFSPGVQPQVQWARPREQLDASFNYTLNDNFVFTLEATNIINSQFKMHAGKPSPFNFQLFNTEISQFDKTVSMGVRYKM